MRIGVDLDGVLNDVAEWHFACGSKFCLENNINRGFNPEGYYMEEQFSLTSDENREFWRQYIFDLLIAIPPRPYAAYAADIASGSVPFVNPPKPVASYISAP